MSLRSPKPSKHTLDTANLALSIKGLSNFITALEISGSTVVLLDKDYGRYNIDIKSLAPKTDIGWHKKRRHQNKLDAMKDKFLGKTIRGLTVTAIFYGPDRGYKNRSFYIEYKGNCGHSGINTYAGITTNKKNFGCLVCDNTKHGERTRIDGVLKKRTPTYTHWQRIKSTLPIEYHDFNLFKKHAGDKYFKRAEIIFIDSKPVWRNLQIVEDTELGLIATAIRQAFRHSSIYLNCIENSKIETNNGPRYRCADCNELFKRTEVQVDHIDPIVKITGENLIKEEIIDRIWTNRIQILDKKCHTKKSAAENKERRRLKKENK